MIHQSQQRKVKRSALVATLIIPFAASLVSGQYRIDNSSSRDANNRLGSGGYNDAGSNGRIGGLAGNYIVTGNVTAGKGFRGALGYTDPSAFRGTVGSGNFDNFVRDSTGVGQLRGDYSRGNVGSTIQPYFGAGQTAAAPAGFARDHGFNNAFVPRTQTFVQSNDARIDYGGASRQQVTQSYLNDQRVTGGAGLATTSGQQWAQGTPQTRPLQLSEYTQLARQSRTGVFAGALTNGQMSSDPTLGAFGGQSANAGTVGANAQSVTGAASGNADAARQAGRPDPRLNGSPLGTGDAEQNDTRLNGNDVITPGQRRDATEGDGAAQSPGLTGQGATIRNTRALENNSQYAELRKRLAANDRQRQLPGAEANAQIREVNAQLVRQRAAGGAQTPAPTGVQGKTPDTGTPVDVKPSATPPVEVGNEIAGAEQRPVPQDTLQLPRPAGDPAAPSTRPAHGDAPLQIKSFASGVKDPNLSRTLQQAEELMRAGKFGSAIESFDRAEELASDDPLVFMGRSIAELGGSYYRKSELHLRQAYSADASLLGATFDLRGLLTDARLNYLTNDLGEVARTNPNDPGPLLLLAFIYYNGGMEDRAARALDLAQERSGGNDPVIKSLKENWALSRQDDLNK